jgi:hypothetical protein
MLTERKGLMLGVHAVSESVMISHHWYRVVFTAVVELFFADVINSVTSRTLLFGTWYVAVTFVQQVAYSKVSLLRFP